MAERLRDFVWEGTFVSLPDAASQMLVPTAIPGTNIIADFACTLVQQFSPTGGTKTDIRGAVLRGTT